MKLHHLLPLAAASALATTASAAVILSNGTGDFAVGSTWVGGTAPLETESFTILSGHKVTLNNPTQNMTRSIRGGSTATVTGELILDSGTFRTELRIGNAVGAGGNLLVNGGRISGNGLARLTWIPGAVGGISITSGTIENINRIGFSSTTLEDYAPSFAMSGGTVNLSSSGNSGFSLYDGVSGGARASFTITGNAGSFSTTNNVVLANTGVSDTGAAIRFNFGTAAGAGALTTITSAGLTLGDNPFTLDFTNITRPLSSTSYSTTLFDYSGTLSGSFTADNLTSIGLAAGESATLVHDTTNKLIRVDYSLVPVPEPGTYGFLAGLGALGLVLLRRRKA